MKKSILVIFGLLLLIPLVFAGNANQKSGLTRIKSGLAMSNAGSAIQRA